MSLLLFVVVVIVVVVVVVVVFVVVVDVVVVVIAFRAIRRCEVISENHSDENYVLLQFIYHQYCKVPLETMELNFEILTVNSGKVTW